MGTALITKACGIYKITNTITGDFYIGSAVDLYTRMRKHQNSLAANRHVNAHLQRSWNKHGSDYFEFSVCEHCEKERLIEREQFYIDNEKPTYNICQVAGSCLGVKRSEIVKQKISEAQRGERNYMFGKHFSDETKQKMSEKKIGIPLTKEHIQKLAEAHKGHVFTEETKHKISEAGMGRKATEEAKHNMSEARRGRVFTEETKLKMSRAHTGDKNENFGKHASEETRRKISEANKGRHAGALNPNFGKHPSEETRRKKSEANKRYWAEKKANA